MERTPKSSDTQRAQEEIRPEVRAFREVISKADGALLPLRKTNPEGKSLYITARYLNSLIEGRDKIDEDYSKWGSAGPRAVLIIDTYTGGPATRLEPVGHMDWMIRNTIASGMHNSHDAPIPANEHERRSNDRWVHASTKSFEVDEKYQQQNIGSLMLATSGCILPTIGVKEFFAGHLLIPAQKTYRRFGLSQEDFLASERVIYQPIERLSEHEAVNKTIAEFV